MSCQRGNVERSRAQKHRNKKVFKNDLHDTNIRTKRINQIQIVNVCTKCKAILEWKIKYKKYKMLKSPKSCNKCHEKSVKEPYHTVCNPCARHLKICPKCEAPQTNANECQENVLSEDGLERESMPSDPELSTDDDSDDSLDEMVTKCSKRVSKIVINTHV